MGKYTPLTKWLSNCTLDVVTLSFSEIERILGFKLPESAHVHNRWWMNDINHSQARGWTEAGYITTNGNKSIITQKIQFERNSFSKQDNRITKNDYTPSDASDIINEKSEACTLPTPFVGKETVTLGEYVFFSTPFQIYEKNIPSPFLQYSKHTVEELLHKKHYSSLRTIIARAYPQYLNQNIQAFMKYLLQCNDQFYLRFLNKNGLDNFCRFGLTDHSIHKKRGLYLYMRNDKIVYIGRCRDNYYNRFNNNYGHINPINCYKEGQSTNTHMNSLMNRHGENTKIYLCPISDIDEIIHAEETLIREMQPIWNRKK